MLNLIFLLASLTVFTEFYTNYEIIVYLLIFIVVTLLISIATKLLLNIEEEELKKNLNMENDEEIIEYLGKKIIFGSFLFLGMFICTYIYITNKRVIFINPNLRIQPFDKVSFWFSEKRSTLGRLTNISTIFNNLTKVTIKISGILKVYYFINTVSKLNNKYISNKNIS